MSLSLTIINLIASITWVMVRITKIVVRHIFSVAVIIRIIIGDMVWITWIITFELLVITVRNSTTTKNFFFSLELLPVSLERLSDLYLKLLKILSDLN